MWDEQQQTLDQETTGGLENLRKQERVWFNWVCRLHDVHAASQTPHPGATLWIARRRWADARCALERAEQQVSRSPDSSVRSESRTQSSD